MMKFVKWTLLVVVVLAVCALGAFLYFIPPFFTTAPEDFTKAMSDAAPPVSNIADPAERAIAERGRYIVMTTGCIGCHATNGPQGPDLTKYLVGGGLTGQTTQATSAVLHRSCRSAPSGLPLAVPSDSTASASAAIDSCRQNLWSRDHCECHTLSRLVAPRGQSRFDVAHQFELHNPRTRP